MTQYNTLEAALELFAKIADARGEPYRAQAYRRAIYTGTAIRDANVPKGNSDIDAKIAEYNSTRGHIRELDDLLAQPETRALIEFDKILGFGPSSIRYLISRGILTHAALIDAVRRQHIDITRMQELGLHYHKDLQRKIPREDVTRISEILYTEIFRTANDVFDGAARILVETTGSYRRRESESGDIDILIASPNMRQRNSKRKTTSDPGHAFFHNLHERMSAMDNFVDIISLGKQKYSFLFKFRWVISIDIILVPHQSYYAALLYFTGSQSFNIWLREQCKKKGYSLNQMHLTAPNGSIILLRSEEHVFEILGIPYIPPTHRSRAPQQRM
jgi:DNA polymerase/3'-5' exonuclease PolX